MIYVPKQKRRNFGSKAIEGILVGKHRNESGRKDHPSMKRHLWRLANSKQRKSVPRSYILGSSLMNPSIWYPVCEVVLIQLSQTSSTISVSSSALSAQSTRPASKRRNDRFTADGSAGFQASIAVMFVIVVLLFLTTPKGSKLQM